VIRIGRGYSGDRQTREGTSAPQKDLKLPQKAELFQTVPASQGLLSTLLCPEPFDSDTLGLNVNPPSCRNRSPKLKNPSKKSLLKQKLIHHFCSTPKKDLHIYNLILQRKLFFHPTSLLIYDLVNPHSIRKV